MLTLKVDPTIDRKADDEDLLTQVFSRDPARLAYVVRAVNAHADLVKALEGMCEEQRHPSPAYDVAQKILASLD